MTGREWWDELLTTDPEDVGCDRTFELLDLYVEAELSGQDGQRSFRGVAAHLRACPACREDYAGVLTAVHDLA